MKHYVAMLLSAVLAANLCIPALAVEQSGIMNEEVSSAAATDYEQAAETEPQENVTESIAEEKKEAETSEEDGSTNAASTQVAPIVEEQEENVINADTADTATTASTAEIAAEVEPADSKAAENTVFQGVDEVTSGETSPWLSDYEYYISEFDGIEHVCLESYNNWESEVSVPATAQVDGVTYQVYVQRASTVWDSSVTSLTFEEGFVFPQDSRDYFYEMSNLESVDMSRADTSEVWHTSCMFQNCSNLREVNMSNIDFSNVIDTDQMFYGCSSLEELDLSCFSGNTGVYSTSYMFSDCMNLKRLNLSGWDWSNVQMSYYAFQNCYSLEELITPENVQQQVELPVTMEDESGRIYSYLPMNQQSVSLQLLSVPDWLKEYRYYFDSDNHLIDLLDYMGSASEIAIPGSVNLSGEEYYFELSNGCPWGAGVTSLSLGEGCRLGRWSYRFFGQMKDLQTLDLRNVDFSNVGAFDQPINGCVSLQYLYLPANMGIEFDLSRIFVDDYNTPYTIVPGDLPYSISLQAASVSEWLEGYTYSISDDTIELNDYRGDKTDIIVGSSAEVNGTTYPKVTFSNGCWTDSYVKNITFEDGVVFPESISWLFEYMNGLESVDFGNPDTVGISAATGTFNYCTSLVEADLSGLDFSGCSYADRMFESCKALETIKTPTGVVADIELPGAFSDGEGTIYTKLPKNLSQSITLTRLEMSEWLEKFRFEVSGDRIILLESKYGYGPGHDYGEFPDNYTLPGFAEIGTSQFNKIEMRKNLWTMPNLKELRFDQGVILPADCNGLFDSCYAETIDLSQLDFSGVQNTDGMFSCCSNLTTIVAPANLSIDVSLPGVFTDENNTLYLYLPKNLSESIILTKTEAGNWLDEYDYYVSGDKIVLTAYKGHDTDITIHGSAVLVGTPFEKIEISPYMFGKFDYSPAVQHLSFERGVQFPADSSELFYGYYALQTIDLANANTSNVTNMRRMFANCSSLTSLDLSGIDTSYVTDMSELFYFCYDLTSVNLNGFETSNVVDMSEMFAYCMNLTSLNVSGFDTSRVQHMTSMFSHCEKLASLDVSNFNTERTSNISYMFNRCDSLLELDLSNWDLSSVGNAKSVFSGKTPVIKAPANVSVQVDLRALYTGDDGLVYGCLPIGADRSIVLTWTSESGDPSGDPSGNTSGDPSGNTSGDPSGDPSGNTSGDPIPTPITILTQPYDVETSVGEDVTFHVDARGNNLRYQWQYSLDEGTTWKNCTASGFNTDTFSFVMQERFNGRKYRCMINNGVGSVYTDVVAACLANTSEITLHPVDTEAELGDTVELTVAATGNDISYQWQYSLDEGQTWKNCSSYGFNLDTFSFVMREKFDGRSYRCVVTADGKELISDTAIVTLKIAQSIITQPEDKEAAEGDTVSFYVEAGGTDISYQWQYSRDGSTWINCTGSGYDTDTFSFVMREKYDGRSYRCIVTADGVQLISDAAVVILTDTNGITLQPEDVAVAEGETAEFHVEFSGSSPAYQWQWSSDGNLWKNCGGIGYNTDTFGFIMKEKFVGRMYRCVVTAGGKTYVSDSATLSLDDSVRIITQPEDVTASAGDVASFHVEARGGDLSYQWQWSSDGTTWKYCTGSGYNTDTFSFTVQERFSGRMYRCRVKNGTDTAYTESGLLTVTDNAEMK